MSLAATNVQFGIVSVWRTPAEANYERGTVVPDKPGSLAKSTLGQILSSQQTGLGAAGLQRLLDRKKRKGRGRDNPPADRNDDDAGANSAPPRRPS